MNALVVVEPHLPPAELLAQTRFSSRRYSMICSWCWFIQPAIVIITNLNGSRALGICCSVIPNLVRPNEPVLFHADPISGPYGIRATGRHWLSNSLQSGSPGKDINARAANPVIFATAKLIPCKLRDSGTPGMGRG